MDIFVLLLAVVLVKEALTSEDCWIPCSKIERGACVSVQCKAITRATFECNMISTVMTSSSKQPPLPQTCVSPNDVPGIPQFCSHLLHNGSSSLENLLEAQPTKPPQTSHKEDILVVNGSECVQITVLAGVAVGCFVSGAVALWLFLLVVCPKKHSCCCLVPAKNIKSSVGEIHRLPETPPARHQCPPERVTSSSHERLLSSTSLDSTSFQIISPRSPTAPSIFPASNTTEFTDVTSNYARLIHATSMQYAGEEADRTNESNGYASLLPRRPRGPKGYSNPYLTLNNGDIIPAANQSNVKTPNATDNETIQTITDGCSAYPSIARSVKSDTHDYESIYNGSNCASSEYDFHDYHLCGAANNVEAHEYFILEKQTPEYLDLEKDALIT